MRLLLHTRICWCGGWARPNCSCGRRSEALSRSAPSGERPVLEQEGDQASELSGVLWGGVELVLELHKSASSLESSSSSCLIFCS
jgi:hypothetical protein